MRGRIVGLGGWLKNSFIDFPRTVATVLFFNRCNLQCPYCHNGSLTTGLENIEDQSEQIWKFLNNRKKTIKGVVLTGGEPTLFPKLATQITEFKDIGYRVKLDTNGLNPQMINSFDPDYLAMDLKSDITSYREIMGSKLSFDAIKCNLEESLGIIKKMGDNAEVRVTIAPNILDRSKIEEMKLMLDGCENIFIQPAKITEDVLTPSFFLNKDRENNQDEMVKFAFEEFSEVVGRCKIRE